VEISRLFQEKFPKLKHLAIKFNPAWSPMLNIDDFSSFLGQFEGQLKELRLQHISAEAFKVVLEKSTFVEALYIQTLPRNALTKCPMTVFENLKKLSFDEEIPIVGQSLSMLRFPRIEELNFIHTRVSHETFRNLIVNMPNLKRVFIEDDEFHDDCVGELCKMYRNGPLKELVLRTPCVSIA
jgi:hypothetical protein